MATWCSDCDGSAEDRFRCVHGLDCLGDVFDRVSEMVNCGECSAGGSDGDPWTDHIGHRGRVEIWRDALGAHDEMEAPAPPATEERAADAPGCTDA